MKTQTVCPCCRGLRSVANLAYPGHVEACPQCEASGYLAVGDGRAVLRTNTSAAANDIGKLRKMLKDKWDLLSLAALSPTTSSAISELAICAWI